MSSFTEPLVVRKIDSHLWMTERAFSYDVGWEGNDEKVTVPVGFRTDFATVPWGLWNVFPPDGEYSQAAVLHDYLYYVQVYTRYKSDLIFYEAMGVLGVPGWRRSMMYMAVRMCGWLGWRRRRKEKKDGIHSRVG